MPGGHLFDSHTEIKVHKNQRDMNYFGSVVGGFQTNTRIFSDIRQITNKKKKKDKDKDKDKDNSFHVG